VLVAVVVLSGGVVFLGGGPLRGDGCCVGLMWAVDAAVVWVVCARGPMYREELFARGEW
jgi:hypothetical protein